MKQWSGRRRKDREWEILTRTLRDRKNEGVVVGKAMMMIVARGKKGSVVGKAMMIMIVA